MNDNNKTPSFPKVTIVVARACNFVIGNQGQLPWNIPEDLKHFKETTMGKSIIMGRHTYDSIGRVLPGRRNIVVSRSHSFFVKGGEVAHSFEEALHMCAGEEEVFLVGGSQLYEAGIKYASKAIITELNFPVIGDAYFMPLDSSEWHITNSSPQQGELVSWRFVTYERMNSPATPE
jgi:dihydrofolate reductase